MRKRTKLWLLIAGLLVVLGAAVLLVSMAASHWNLNSLRIGAYETNTFEVSEDFRNITIDTETADIVFAASEDSTCRVVTHDREKTEYTAAVLDGTLTVSAADHRQWYEYIGFVFDSSTVTVYLPKDEYAALQIRESTGNIEIPGDFRFEQIDICASTGNVHLCASASKQMKIVTSTGNIRAERLSAETITLSVSTGNVTLTDAACQSIVSDGSTGNMVLERVNAAQSLSIERSTGDVKLLDSDAAKIYVKTSTGDISGSLLTEKLYVTETSTGLITVPKTSSGGICELITSTGNISFS